MEFQYSRSARSCGKSTARRYLSEYEQERIEAAEYWLCASKEVDNPYGDEGNELYEEVDYAMAALQIICPSGGASISLKLHRTDAGFDNVGSNHEPERLSWLVGRIASVEERDVLSQFDAVYSGVKEIFRDKIVRLQNPILLLQHAQQKGNVPLSCLMCVMGLDVLFMASERGAFLERVGGFLGRRADVFPEVDHMGGKSQLQVTVDEVLQDLYSYRDTIAHGREIPESPYRQPYELKAKDGCRINMVDYSYAELMLESAIFMLAGAVRTVLLDGLIGDVRDGQKWRNLLRKYEHRYRNTPSLV